MFGIGVCCSENVTLFGRPNYKCHIKSQPLEVTHDKAFIAKWPTGKMGHIVISIWNTLFTTESHKRTSGGGFPGWASRSKGNRTLRRSPDEVAEVCQTQTSFKRQVWQLFFDGALRIGPKGYIIAGVGVVLVSPQNYVIPRAVSLTRALLQQCSGV